MERIRRPACRKQNMYPVLRRRGWSAWSAWLLVAMPIISEGFAPLLQRQRPPEQTAAQRSAQAKLVARAKEQSDAAQVELLDYLDKTVRPSLQGTALGPLSSEELLERMVWEFKRLPLIHNAPFDEKDPAGIQDDTILETTISNAYLQNVCQRYALGVESPDNLKGEHGIMTFFLGLPNFAKELDPTLREANDCVLYVANNLRKTAAGNFVYGSLTYAMNPVFADRLTLTPFDTGAYSHDHGVSFGTLDNFYHLVLPHVRVLNYNLAEVFKRWWIPSTPTPHIGNFPYFEVQWFGNAWMPESLLYVLAKFSSNGKGEGVWGTHVGKSLQAFLSKNNRPLLWADGDDSGILIDPTVGNIAGNPFTTADVARFEQLWSTSPTWKDLYDGSPPHLRFTLLSYDAKGACSQQEQDHNNMIMGMDGNGACVYWVVPELQPDRWECLNDGTCGKTHNTDGTYDSEQECLQNCGDGNWACVRGIAGARQNAHHCEPDLFGPCPSLAACEQRCGGADSCAPVPPAPLDCSNTLRCCRDASAEHCIAVACDIRKMVTIFSWEMWDTDKDQQNIYHLWNYRYEFNTKAEQVWDAIKKEMDWWCVTDPTNMNRVTPPDVAIEQYAQEYCMQHGQQGGSWEDPSGRGIEVIVTCAPYNVLVIAPRLEERSDLAV